MVINKSDPKDNGCKGPGVKMTKDVHCEKSRKLDKSVVSVQIRDSGTGIFTVDRSTTYETLNFS